MNPPTGRHRRAGEAGSFVVLWLLAIALTGMLMFFLVADASRVLAGLDHTSDVARIAARAGARHVDPSTGLLDGYRAAGAAHDELAAARMTGTVEVDGSSVTVTARHTIRLPRLAAVGISRHTVESTRTAQAVSDPTGGAS